MTKKLAIIRTGALGDILLLRPCLWGIKTAVPEIEITAFVPGDRGKLLGEGGLADHVFDINRIEGCWLFGPHDEAPQPLREAFADIDTALVYLEPSDGIKQALEQLGVSRVHFFPANPDPALDQHASEHLWDGIAEALEERGLFMPATTDLPPLIGNRNEAQIILRELGLRPGAYFCVHPGSGSPKKNMSIDFCVSLLDSVLNAIRTGHEGHEHVAGSADDFRFAIVSGEADGDNAEQLHKKVESSLILPKMTLSTLCGVLGLSCGYLGNDSGVSHLAGQSGVLTNAVFISTPARQWSPVGPQVRCLSLNGK